MIARVSGYGQTCPYAPRAGFARSRGDGRHALHQRLSGEPPPRIHISLGDSLAGMFAVQGILAALYRRDALGGGRGQIIDVSLMEACFALLESTVPEYDRLHIVRGPGGTGLAGVAPSNIFKSSDDKWMVIAANADRVFQRLCEAMGQSELADDPKYATHHARGVNQEDSREIVAEWASRHAAAEIDRLLNDAVVICGPIYTIADIFEDEQFRARRCWSSTWTRSSASYVGPGIVPKFSETPCEFAVRDLGGRQPQPRRLGGLLESRMTSSRDSGRRVCCDRDDLRRRSPHGLQNEDRRLDPRRAPIVNRLAATGLQRIEVVQLRQPGPRPAEAGAEEVVAAIDRRADVVYAGWR